MKFQSETQQLPVTFGPMGPWDQVSAFFGQYDLRVYVRPGVYVDVGRGSLMSVQRLQLGGENAPGCIGRIGQFVQPAACVIHARLEHRNDEAVNCTFTGIPVIWFTLQDEQLKSLTPKPDRAPLEIGDNVILSHGCVVLSGAKIARGVVIGANAVVRDAPEPFGIYAGTPARKIGDRFSPEIREQIERVRWWDFTTTYMGRNLRQLQQLAAVDGAHEYRAETPRFLFDFNKVEGRETFELRGFVENGAERPLSEAPDKVIAYARQALTGGTEWVSNIWLA